MGCAIVQNRFFEILRLHGFDLKSNHSQRIQTNNFALFSEVWNQFIDNCQRSYKSVGFITVDEQLFSSADFVQEKPLG